MSDKLQLVAQRDKLKFVGQGFSEQFEHTPPGIGCSFLVIDLGTPDGTGGTAASGPQFL